MSSRTFVVSICLLALAAAPAAAQGRGRHAGPRTVIVYPAYHPFYGFAQWGHPGPVWGYPGFPSPVVYAARQTSTVRTQVTPREAQVFIDGYAAGVVDDFDGVFQRLQLAPGHHDITIYLPGYRTYHEAVYLNPGSNHNVRHTMMARPDGEANDPPPAPAYAPPRPRPGPFVQVQPSGRTGSIALRVAPADAEVRIDGERWRGSSSQQRLVVQVPEGRHRVEVTKDGFEPFSAEIDVRAGETETLNVALTAP